MVQDERLTPRRHCFVCAGGSAYLSMMSLLAFDAGFLTGTCRIASGAASELRP